MTQIDNLSVKSAAQIVAQGFKGNEVSVGITLAQAAEDIVKGKGVGFSVQQNLQLPINLQLALNQYSKGGQTSLSAEQKAIIFSYLSETTSLQNTAAFLVSVINYKNELQTLSEKVDNRTATSSDMKRFQELQEKLSGPTAFRAKILESSAYFNQIGLDVNKLLTKIDSLIGKILINKSDFIKGGGQTNSVVDNKPAIAVVDVHSVSSQSQEVTSLAKSAQVDSRNKDVNFALQSKRLSDNSLKDISFKNLC